MTCIWRGSVWSAEELEEPDVFKKFVFLFVLWLGIILYFALTPSYDISLHFLVILQDHCFFLLSLFSALSPFSHSNAAETYLLQFMMSFLWRWKRGQVDHVVWHLVDVGCDDDGGEVVGTIMKKALMVVTMKMLSGVSINILSEVKMKICCQWWFFYHIISLTTIPFKHLKGGQ